MIRLQTHCGCGVHYDSLVDAEEHADQTGHIMNVAGSIQSDNPPLAVKAFVKEKAKLTQQEFNSVLWDEASITHDIHLSKLHEGLKNQRGSL
jgi:hypothetical protein